MLVNMKGAVIGYGMILGILLVTSFVAIYITRTGDVRREIVTTEGKIISFINEAELLVKTFNQSIEFVSQRAAYDLGKNSGFDNEVFIWNYFYPRLDTLGRDLDKKIEDTLPSQDIITGDRIVDWGTGEISAQPTGFIESSESFSVVGNKSFYVHDKSIETKVSWDPFRIRSFISSSYFKLLYVGRQILENETYNTTLHDIGNLSNLLERDYPDLDFNITTAIEYPNLIKNPSFEADFNEWTSVYTELAEEKIDNTVFYDGTKSYYLNDSDINIVGAPITVATARCQNFTVELGRLYKASVWFNVLEGNLSIWLTGGNYSPLWYLGECGIDFSPENKNSMKVLEPSGNWEKATVFCKTNTSNLMQLCVGTRYRDSTTYSGVGWFDNVTAQLSPDIVNIFIEDNTCMLFYNEFYCLAPLKSSEKRTIIDNPNELRSFGDVNGDCIINQTDVDLCQTHFLENWSPCDFNLDGNVTNDDKSFITGGGYWGSECKKIPYDYLKLNFTINSTQKSYTELKPDFALEAVPPFASIDSGESTNSSINVRSIGGDVPSIHLSYIIESNTTHLPEPTIKVSLDRNDMRPNFVSTMRVETKSWTLSDTYIIRITGTAGSISKTTEFSLTVNPIMQFSLEAIPTSADITQGDTIIADINITFIGGTAVPVFLSSSSIPDTTITFLDGVSPSNNCIPSCTLRMRIATQSTTPTGNHEITITGIGGGVRNSTKFYLGMHPPFDYEIHLSSYYSEVYQKRYREEVVTIENIVPTSLSQPVSLTSTVTRKGTTNIEPTITVTFMPSNSCTPALICFITMNITTTASTPIGSYIINVEPNGNPSKSRTYELNVTMPPFDFDITLDSYSGTIEAGQFVTPVATLTTIEGTPENVRLSYSISSAEPTISVGYNPSNTCMPSPTCLINLNITTQPKTPTQTGTPPGDYYITIIGTASGGRVVTTPQAYKLTVTRSSFKFGILLSSYSSTIAKGKYEEETVKIRTIQGDPEEVTLGYSINPSESTINVNYLSTNKCTPSPSECLLKMNVTTETTTPERDYTIKVIGSSATTSAEVSYILTITGCIADDDCGTAATCRYYKCESNICVAYNRTAGYIDSRCGTANPICPDKCESDHEYSDGRRKSCDIVCSGNGNCQASCTPSCTASDYGSDKTCYYGCRNNTDCWKAYFCSEASGWRNEIQCISCCDGGLSPCNCGCSISAQTRREDASDPSCSYNWDCCTHFTGPVCDTCGWCTETVTASCTEDTTCTYGKFCQKQSSPSYVDSHTCCALACNTNYGIDKCSIDAQCAYPGSEPSCTYHTGDWVCDCFGAVPFNCRWGDEIVTTYTATCS